MYCHNCGHKLPDHGKFCPNCGTQRISESQPQPNSHDGRNKRRNKTTISKKSIVKVLVSAIVAALIFSFAGTGGDEDKPDPTVYETTEATVNIPDNGWYIENGERYYFQDGAMYVDVQEIDGEYYYFHEDGTLAVNSDVNYDGWVFKTDRDGIITRVIFDKIGGEWSEEKYRFGGSGSSSILELAVPIEECTSMTFYLEANGERGAKVNGKWKIYVRNNGKWNFLQEINYSEPRGSFDLKFDEPVSFDAITAYPTVQGNASYSSFFYPQNVDCPFDVLLDLM